jgi:HSP20 family protein
MAVKQTDVEQGRQSNQQPSGQSGKTGESGQTERGRQQEQGETQKNTQPGQQTQTREQGGLARSTSSALMSPFTLLQRFFTDDISELFGELGSSRGRRTSQPSGMAVDIAAWAPKIDVVQRGNELVVRADLPGVNPDNVVVEIGDDAITISGERQQEHEEERGSVYRYERSYGAFYRVIPLPEGAIADQAKASFKDGVLEITVPAPPEQVSRGRRVEITRGDNASTSTSKDDSTRDKTGS